MREKFHKFKQKLRSRGNGSEPAKESLSPEPTSQTTQATNAPTQLTESPLDEVGNLGNALMESVSTAPPSQEVSTASPEMASYDQPVGTGLSERLWTKAYDNLKEKESDLVKAYETILLKVQAEWTEAATPPDVSALQHCKNDQSRQIWMMVYTGLERSKRQAKYKDTASNYMEAINSIKGVVDKVVKYSAEAAVAWAGVSLGLEILSNPMKEPGLNRKAIAYVLSKMEWYWNLTEMALGQEEPPPPSTPFYALRNNLQDHIVEFYKELLMFQMRSACLYYRNWASVILRDMVKLDDWNAKLNDLKASEAAIWRDIKQFNSEEVKVKLAGMENNSTIQANLLENIYSAIREEARLREIKEQDEKDKDCLRALHITDPQLDKQRIQIRKRGPLTQSCDWAFANNAYTEFIADNTKRILWINGLPGKGKTMLACGIIDELRKSLRPLAFFFCEASATKDNSSDETGAIRGLIYMLLEYQPSLMSILRPYYEKMGDKLFDNINSGIILVDILTKMLQDSSLRETIIVIDALDECHGRSSLINVINNLSRSCPTKWIVTSRPWPEIRTELSAAQGLISLSLEDEKESVSEAVKSYIKTTVDDLARSWGDDTELKGTISEYMYSHADNTFLWVALVCQRLGSSNIPKRRVLEELKKFPATLDDLYHNMLMRIMKSGEEDRLTQILGTVCITYRRLTPAELATLMGDMEEDDVADAIDWCGSFLDCQNGEIFLIHQSAREFLLNKVPGKTFAQGIELQHHVIFLRSLEALSATLKRDIYKLDDPGLASSQISTPDPDPLAPIRYSCVYWVDHLKSSKTGCGASGHDLEDGGMVHQFFQTKYLNWIEALSLLGRVPEGILAVRNLEAMADLVKAKELGDLLQDARRFALSHKPAIEAAPLQVYASALVFSPTRSLVKQLYSSEALIQIIPPNFAGLDWNACLQTMEHNATPSQRWPVVVCFSTDGQLLASGSKNVKVWSTSTGACLQVLEGHEALVQAVEFSPNNLLLASGSEDWTVRLWDPMTGACKHVLRGHHEDITALSFSSDSSTIASASLDGVIKIWCTFTGTCVRTIDDMWIFILSMAFLSDNERLATVTNGGRIDVVDLSTGRVENRDEGGDYADRTDAFVAGCAQVITATKHCLQISDLSSDEGPREIRCSETISSVALAPGCRVATGSEHGGKIQVRDVHTGESVQTLEGHTGRVNSLAFTSNGMQLASGSVDGTIRIWNILDRPDLPTQSKRETPSTLFGVIHALSDDICLSASLCMSVLVVWDMNTGACLRGLRNRKKKGRAIMALPLSSDGKRLALASDDYYLSIWDVSTSTRTQTFKGDDDDKVTCAIFSSDDELLISGSAYGLIEIWNPVTGACLKTLGDRCSPAIHRLAITPDKRRIASLSGRGIVNIWDIASGICLGTSQESDEKSDSLQDQIMSMALSCDSEQLALGMFSGRIYIVKDGSYRQSFNIGDCEVVALAFSPDERLLAAASTPNCVKVWDISTETCLCSMNGFITQLSWDPYYDSRLRTNFGDFDVPRSWSESQEEPVKELVSVGLGISSDNAWILRQGQPILWLPTDYRPRVVTIRGNDVVITCTATRSYVLRFPTTGL